MSIEVEIDADTGAIDAAQALAVIQKVVTTDVSIIRDAVPDYWRPWFGAQPAVRKTGKHYCKPAGEESHDAEQAMAGATSSGTTQPQTLKVTADGIRVFRVGNGVKPPRPQWTPDPAYTPVAKQAGLQGTSVLKVVVNAKGEPTDIGIERPLGGGLDDKAIEIVKQWKFTPATFDNNPVAVQINVEMNFSLY